MELLKVDLRKCFYISSFKSLYSYVKERIRMIKNYWALFYLTLIGMIIFVSLFILGLVVSIAN